MAFIANAGAVHSDLAARNIFIDANSTCKVGDFGLARNQAYTADDDAEVPVKWTPPEALEHGTFSTKGDVWSFGILLVSALSGDAVPGARRYNSEDVVHALTLLYVC